MCTGIDHICLYSQKYWYEIFKIKSGIDNIFKIVDVYEGESLN